MIDRWDPSDADHEAGLFGPERTRLARELSTSAEPAPATVAAWNRLVIARAGAEASALHQFKALILSKSDVAELTWQEKERLEVLLGVMRLLREDVH